MPQRQAFIKLWLRLEGYTPVTVDPLWASLKQAMKSLLTDATEVLILSATAEEPEAGGAGNLAAAEARCFMHLAVQLDSRDVDAAMTTLEKTQEGGGFKSVLEPNGFSELTGAGMVTEPEVEKDPAVTPTAEHAHKTLLIVLSFIAALLTIMAVYCLCVHYKDWRRHRDHQLVGSSVELSDHGNFGNWSARTV